MTGTNAIEIVGNSLKDKKPYSEEMNYVLVSYKEMMDELMSLVQEISIQNEDIVAMNDEISRSYEELQNYQGKLLSIIEFLSSIVPEKSMEDFMEDILELTLSLIPAADGGSGGIVEGEYFRYLAQRGYTDILKENKFPRDIILLTEEPIIFRNLHNEFNSDIPEKYKRIFEQAGSPRIKSSLAVGLKTDQIIGNIFLDSFSDYDAFTDEDKRILEAVSKISSVYIYLKLSLQELDDTYIGMIRALAYAVEIKDKYTKGHSDRVAEYSLKLGEVLGFSRQRKRLLKEAALLHDIGKIGVPDSILNKSGSLTDEEFEQIKMHTVYGGKVLNNVENLQEVAKIVRHHHERWDGRGYPDGLKGDQIPLESRIISIFDAFDTILTTRSYKKALPFTTAVEEIKKNSGTQFDPELVEVFLRNVSIDWVQPQCQNNGVL